MESTPPTVSSSNRSKLNFNLSLDPRWIIFALIFVIVAMFFVWKPWSDTVSANARTVTVTGDTTLKASPDEYVFNPSYQFTNAEKSTAIDAAEAKSTEVVAKLKLLGVTDKQIKTYVDGYQNSQPKYISEPQLGMPQSIDSTGDYIYTLRVTVTVSERATAQKVQDYLATTEPTGAVTPSPTFSEKLRKQLESKARDQATRDARAKADQSARNLGFKVSSVKSVNDGSGFDGTIRPMMGTDISVGTKAESSPNLSVQPGENELSYSVTVVYYIK